MVGYIFIEPQRCQKSLRPSSIIIIIIICGTCRCVLMGSVGGGSGVGCRESVMVWLWWWWRQRWWGHKLGNVQLTTYLPVCIFFRQKRRRTTKTYNIKMCECAYDWKSPKHHWQKFVRTFICIILMPNAHTHSAHIFLCTLTSFNRHYRCIGYRRSC